MLTQPVLVRRRPRGVVHEAHAAALAGRQAWTVARAARRGRIARSPVRAAHGRLLGGRSLNPNRTLTSCSHTFHAARLQPLLDSRDNCPLCRVPMVA